MAGIEDYYLISTNDQALQPYVTDGVISFPSPPFEGDEAWGSSRLAGYYAVPKGQIDDLELDWFDENGIVYYSASFNQSNQVIGGNLPNLP